MHKCNAICTKIDRTGQYFSTDHDSHPVIILSGLNRAQGVNVGDKGVMEYISNSNCGLWYFYKGAPS